MTKVQWPDGAYGTQDDLSAPIQALLRDLHLLEGSREVKDAEKVEKGLGNTTPVPLQVITAGATSLSKVTASWVAGLGGASAALGTVLALLTDPTNSAPLVLVVVAAVAAVVAASVLALAMIVRADLQARSTATSAEYAARAETAAALLRGSSTRPSPPPEPRYWTKTPAGEVFPVKGLAYKGRQIWLDTGGRQLTQDEIDCISPY